MGEMGEEELEGGRWDRARQGQGEGREGRDRRDQRTG
jgi:hypothetical protein